MEIEIEEAHGELDSGDGVLTGGDGGVDEHEEVESYPLVGSDGVGGGRRGGLHGSRGATALMARGGASDARAGARPGSRRSGASAGRSEAA